MRIFHVFKRIQANYRAHRLLRQVYFVQVQYLIHTYPLTHVYSHIFLSREQWAKIGKAFLSTNLQRPKFVNWLFYWKSADYYGYQILYRLSHLSLSLWVNVDYIADIDRTDFVVGWLG